MKVKMGRPVSWPNIRSRGKGASMPFGYIASDDPEILVPDTEKRYEIRGEKLTALEVRDFAARLLRSGNYTQATLREWFSQIIGKNYSPTLLFAKRYQNKHGKKYLIGYGLLTDDWRKSLLQRSLDGRFTDSEEERTEEACED